MTLGLQLWFISATLEKQGKGDTQASRIRHEFMQLRDDRLLCRQELQHLLRKNSRSQMGELLILDGEAIAVDLEEAERRRSLKLSEAESTAFFSVQEHPPL